MCLPFRNVGYFAYVMALAEVYLVPLILQLAIVFVSLFVEEVFVVGLFL